MSALGAAQVRAARMVSLQLDGASPRTPLAVAKWFGALQAQDAASGHWSLGVRCPGLTERDVVDAFERRELIRTWPMRGTIHIVPARDAGWMLDLTAARTLAAAGPRRDRLGLTEADMASAIDALENALKQGGCLTRAQALAAVEDAGTSTTGQRGYHLLWHAAHLGVIAIGPQRGSDQTFVLLSDWAPDPVRLDPDEALVELLFRYVRSHGPVPLKDFAGWSGLTLADARRAATGNDGRLREVPTEVGPMWVTDELGDALEEGSVERPRVVALPGFDEFLLGYKDRVLQLPGPGMAHVVPGGNGMFRSTIAVDGRAVATWSRTPRASGVDIAIDVFDGRLSGRQLTAAERSLRDYGRFVGRPVRVSVTGS